MGEDAPWHELRSFGRRRGRKLSPRQQHLLDEVLPRVSVALADPCPVSPVDLFSPPVRRVWLEIGFGGGEHLIWQARANPEVGLIGCEVFEEGVVKALSGVETHRLGNVRVCDQDARAALRWLPAASVERAFILFPDPWPKKRHVKRRLINRALMDELARVMSPEAELRIATDIGDYLRTILIALQGHPAFAWRAEGPGDWRVRPSDWPPTRYEAKAEREGRRRYFLRLVRGGAL
ncbi:MAG: tRNA (guanosine(46)-N7)-methyltransferase TrmB [Hyphomicrobium sp.]|jgi:tRNA (guanine-N7-)-methyltransferase